MVFNNIPGKNLSMRTSSRWSTGGDTDESMRRNMRRSIRRIVIVVVDADASEVRWVRMNAAQAAGWSWAGGVVVVVLESTTATTGDADCYCWWCYR
jgi:hypothetical protein